MFKRVKWTELVPPQWWGDIGFAAFPDGAEMFFCFVKVPWLRLKRYSVIYDLERRSSVEIWFYGPVYHKRARFMLRYNPDV